MGKKTARFFLFQFKDNEIFQQHIHIKMFIIYYINWYGYSTKYESLLLKIQRKIVRKFGIHLFLQTFSPNFSKRYNRQKSDSCVYFFKMVNNFNYKLSNINRRIHTTTN